MLVLLALRLLRSALGLHNLYADIGREVQSSDALLAKRLSSLRWGCGGSGEDEDQEALHHPGKDGPDAGQGEACQAHMDAVLEQDGGDHIFLLVLGMASSCGFRQVTFTG